MKHAWNYDRIDLVFDRYFEKSIKEGTRSGRGEGSQHLFEGSSTEIPYKMAESFLKKQPKQEWTERIFVFQIALNSLSPPSSCSELDTQVSVHPCETEEADQRLVRHTLNLTNNEYKNVLVRKIDTAVLVLLVSYFE